MLLGDLPPPLLPPYTVKYSSALLFTGRRKTSSSRVAAACFMVECDDESFSFYFGRHGRGRPQRSMWPFTGRWPNLTLKPHLGRIDLVHFFSLIMSIVYVHCIGWLPQQPRRRHPWPTASRCIAVALAYLYAPIVGKLPILRQVNVFTHQPY